MGMNELFTTPSQLLTTLRKNAFENIVGKGENGGNQHFLFSHKVFYSIKNRNHDFRDISSANTFNLDKSKILSFGNELNSIFLEHGSNIFGIKNNTQKETNQMIILYSRAHFKGTCIHRKPRTYFTYSDEGKKI